MKTALRIFFAACLLAALSSGVLAAGPGMSYFDDFVPQNIVQMSMIAPVGDHLFSTEEQGPQLSLLGFSGIDGPNVTLVDAEYCRNDFVYGELFYLDLADLFIFSGGYLWEDPGVFASLDYMDFLGANGYIVSGGYRFDLGGGSYAALSLDYSEGDFGNGFAGDALVKYYADGLKLSGQLCLDEDGVIFVHGKANVAAGDRLVWGGGLTWFDGDNYDVFAGLTWTGEKSLLDCLIDLDEAGEVMYYLSYLYSLSDALAVGINYMDGYMGGSLVGLRGRCQLGEGALSFSYTTPADGWEGAVIGLGYEKSL